MRTKLVVILLLLFCLPSIASPQKISLDFRGATLDVIFKEIINQSDLHLVYDTEKAEQIQRDARYKNVEINMVLRNLLAGTNLDYEFDNGVYVIVEKAQAPAASRVRLSGRVVDQNGAPIIGAAVVVEGTTVGNVTDKDGRFVLSVPRGETVIVVSFLGKETQKITLPAIGPNESRREINVTLEDTATKIQDVVVTGIYTRPKESFTGSATTYTAVDLQNMGSSNVLQSLKTLDPTFAIIEDNEYGSDPNRLPNMEIRGKSSVLGLRDAIEADPNQPLFILDGFESSVAAVMDLDINRVESITILKDAASTAIYGSKAANGVIVVETVKPKAGELRVRYNGSANVSMPDLTSYNLMNSREKLMFDVLNNRYTGGNAATPETDLIYKELYNEKLAAVESGIDTYWLAEPLRVGVNHKHSLYVEGGEGNFLFGLGGGYNGNSGVMKESLRQVISGNIDLIYRVSKFQFSNKFTVSNTKMKNPVVRFQQYAQASPYYKKRNDDGTLSKWLENNQFFQASNPIWNAAQNSRDIGTDLTFSNFFVAEYSPSQQWKIRARFGITYQNNDTENFVSRDDTQFTNAEDTRKGRFTAGNTRMNQYEGELTATWARQIEKHRINLVAGGNISSRKSLLQGYVAEGFPEGDFTYPSFANGYQEYGVPQYREAIDRSLNGYLNAGYAFDDRYLMDFSLRTSGSSIFGTNKRFNTTWSVGLGWNIHREKFVTENLPWINHFKIRASIGNPGNQNFDSAKTLYTYGFQYGMNNYFGMSALLDQIGNPDLEWQTTVDRNIGVDITLFDRRFSLTADYYYKVTDPLLIEIYMPESSAVKTYWTNAGEQVSKGFTLSASYYIFRNIEERFMWMVRANLRTQSTTLNKIGNKLAEYNNNARGNNTTRYYDGADPDDIWVVRSAGIDPANGMELFYTADGRYTYEYAAEDEVICGNTRPDIEGVIGTQLTWKGFTLNFNFRYQVGADIFNRALFDKVENISSGQLKYNQDKRALYERWHKPGDIVHFKDIANSTSSPMSSRFVQRENVLSLESIHLSYEFYEGWIKRVGLSNLRVYFSMRDVFRSSTVRSERGIYYPFARSLEAGLSFNF